MSDTLLIGLLCFGLALPLAIGAIAHLIEKRRWPDTAFWPMVASFIAWAVSIFLLAILGVEGHDRFVAVEEGYKLYWVAAVIVAIATFVWLLDTSDILD